MKISIIVPCYNEGLGIENLYTQLNPVLSQLSEKNTLEIIFVNDGSTDNTQELLQKYFGSRQDVQIVNHEKNKNLGAAIRTGFAHATGEVIVTLDSDCTYNPAEIPQLLNLLGPDADIITASPYHPMGGIKNVPKYRLFLSKSITQIYRWLTGAKIYTYTALFRAYKSDVIRNVSFESNDFLSMAEIMIKAINQGYKVKEFPTILSVRQYGESKIRLFKVIRSHFKFASKLLFLKLFK
ncbi:glycosyltransferase family 2 protein [Candidatus Woesearchaeota archaeon]|nr:glycosyltransferase family 2 protein [Candidatus Woesearchaeota archaeon]